MDLELFDEVSEAVLGLVPDELGEPRRRARRYGIKVWFGPAQPTREHYEAQLIGAAHVDGAHLLAIEVGFHSEHPDRATNDQVIAHLVSQTKRWRRALGDDTIVGPFLGRPDDWRRVSETWSDPDLGEPDLAFELAARLTDYITALEPIRRTRPT